MNRISDVNKIDVAIAPASLNGANTGSYFPLGNYRKALFVANLGTMAAAATSALQVMQATDAAGTGAAVITGATATITANTNASTVLLSIVSAAGGVHVAGETVTINGLVFTAAAADVPGTRTYAVGATGAASAANLLAKINDATVGVPGVLGTASVVGLDDLITLTSTEPGETVITAVASAATTVVSTLSAVGFIEVDAATLNVNAGFTHVAIRVTNSAAMVTGISLVRGDARFSPDQQVAASFAS